MCVCVCVCESEQCTLAELAAAALFVLLLRVVADDANQLMECGVDVERRLLGAGLDVRGPELSGELAALLLAHAAHVHQVHLVGRQQHRVRLPILDAQDLRVEVADVLVALLVGDGVHQQEAVALAHVLLAHRAELLLPRRVQHVEYAPLSVDLGVLYVGVLDGGVVVRHEQLLEELDGDGALAHAAVSHHHQLDSGQVLIGRARARHVEPAPLRPATSLSPLDPRTWNIISL